MTSRSKFVNRKPGTPRLPIRKQQTIHELAAKAASANRSAAAPRTASGSVPVSAIASSVGVDRPAATQPPQLPPSEPTRHFDLSQERLLTAKEAGYRLGKSSDTIREWLRTGRLRGWQPGGRGCPVLISEASLEEVLIQPLGFRMQLAPPDRLR